MSDLKLNGCPICGGLARFEYGDAMDSGKRIVKARCVSGCVEQVIFHCEEEDAAKSWNFRATSPETRETLDMLLNAVQTVMHAPGLTSAQQLLCANAVAKALGKSIDEVIAQSL